MNMISGKILDVLLHASECHGTHLEQVTFTVLDFAFYKPEHAEYFKNTIYNIVPCIIIKALPDMVSVKVIE